MPQFDESLQAFNRHVRTFVEYGGSSPENPLQFADIDTQYMLVGSVEDPITGDISPVWGRDPRNADRFRRLGNSLTPPDLPTFTVTFMERLGTVPEQFMDIGCATFYLPVGNCTDLSDINNGPTSSMTILSNAKARTRSMNDRSTLADTDDPLKDDLEWTADDIYTVGALSFGEKGGVQISREVVDAVWGVKGNCLTCTRGKDYVSWGYAITKSSGAGSPGLPSEVQYTLDGTTTWIDVNISNMGATEDPVAIDIVGDKLVVLSRTAGSATLGGYYYTTIDSDTGIPGAVWTKVIAGFEANKQPNDLFVQGHRTYFAADGGYVYYAANIESGVTVLSAGDATTSDLLRIHGDGQHLVAVGKASTIIRSQNGGATWGTPAASVSAIALDIGALWVSGAKGIWVGTLASGRVFWTRNGGKTWTQVSFAGAGAGNVRDIVAPTEECITFAYDNNDPTAYLYSSRDAGNTFVSGGVWTLDLPVFDRTNRIAIPQGPSAKTMTNYMLLAGLGGNGVDGILVKGQSNIF